MKDTILVIYDNTVRKSEIIEDVIGSKGFADVVVQKKRLEVYYIENICKIFPDAIYHTVNTPYDFERLYNELVSETGTKIRVIHCFSNFIFSDFDKAKLSFIKLEFIEQNYKVLCGKQLVAVMFSCLSDYLSFLGCTSKTEDGAWAIADNAREIYNRIEIEGMTDIGETSHFIQCITGNFDARYFNSLQGDEYVVVKRSKNKKKIRMEYQYYQLLPEDMKYWFVMPFNFQENENDASYMMERLHMTDVAIKWVHGSFPETEFKELLDKYFYFFNHRHKKNITHEEYESIAGYLYRDKVKQRINDLKQLPEYEVISKMLKGVDLNIEDLYEKYLLLKEKIETNAVFESVSVIGHGDSCFANTLYNKSTKTLKFIDPKGALEEEEIWTNPYYDIAKLSHSICGLYDFFNNALFEIKVSEEFRYELTVEFDNAVYKEIFKNKLSENGYDYQVVRLYEASLFLSMLPLHIDYPYKVFGFILNAKNILEEIEKDVS